LVTNTCSPNLSVYSIKLLRANFKLAWESDKKTVIPSLGASPYFSKDFKAKHNTVEVTKRSLEYSLRNFRAFCSWNGDVSNYRMLIPYIKNPYVMSYIYNHLREKMISVDKKTKQSILIHDPKSIQVACEDMICRKRSSDGFKRLFPRMTGSSNLKTDLYNMYCDHFMTTRYLQSDNISTINKWMDQQVQVESKVEALHFLSFITKYPEPMLVIDKFINISEFFKENIRHRWDKWADEKLKKFDNEQLYEEPLEIRLISQKSTDDLKKGRFNILFDVGLSEVDRVLDGVDKIDTSIFLSFDYKYLAYIKERENFYVNRGYRDRLEDLKEKLTSNIRLQMQRNKTYFNAEIWTSDIARIIGDELINQLKFYLGSKIDKLSRGKVKVPVKFRFGTFALRYIHQRHNYLEKRAKARSFN